VAALRERGFDQVVAGELIDRCDQGRGSAASAVGADLRHLFQTAGESPESADLLLSTLLRLVPHLEDDRSWRGRAAAFDLLGEAARSEPAHLIATMADLHSDRLPVIRSWARVRGVAILPADANLSSVDSEWMGRGHRTSVVRLGLLHLPEIDRATAEVIVLSRAGSPFTGPEDLVRRLRGRITDSALRALVGVGASSAAAPAALRARSGHLSRGARRPMMAARATAGTLEQGKGTMQFDLFASGRPGARIYTPVLAGHGILNIEGAGDAPDGSRVRTVGIIRGLKGIVGRGGQRLAAARLEDGGAALDLLILPVVLEKTSDVPLGRPVILEGRVSRGEGSVELVVENAVPLGFLSMAEQPVLEVVLPARFRRTRALKLRLLQSPGRSPLRVRGRDAEGRAAATELRQMAVTLDESLISDLRRLVGEDNVILVGGGAERAGAA
jgi:DNA polymerase III alpha subunit